MDQPQIRQSPINKQTTMQPHGNHNAHRVKKPSIETRTAQAMHYASKAPATTIRMVTHQQTGHASTNEPLVINNTEE